jgi:hypothetical protein
MNTTPTSARLTAPSPRRTPTRSPWHSRKSAWPAFALAGSILAAMLLAGCQSKPPAVITADRQIVHLPDGRYAVTETWLKERYQLERALRLQAEQCEALK